MVRQFGGTAVITLHHAWCSDLPVRAALPSPGGRMSPLWKWHQFCRAFAGISEHQALIAGALIGIVFGAANAYIGLKVGMTVSASIPAAVMYSGVRLRPRVIKATGSAPTKCVLATPITGTCLSNASYRCAPKPGLCLPSQTYPSMITTCGESGNNSKTARIHGNSR